MNQTTDFIKQGIQANLIRLTDATVSNTSLNNVPAISVILKKKFKPKPIAA